MNINKVFLVFTLTLLFLGITYATDDTIISEDTVVSEIESTNLNSELVEDKIINEELTVNKEINKENIENNTIKTASQSIDVNNFDTLHNTLTSTEYDTLTLNINSDIILTNNTKLNMAITNLTINGNGKTIDGNNIYSFLSIETGTVTINNIIIINCIGEYGGAIYNDGTLTITNTNINNNTATDDGGAIYNDGTLTITNTNINNNTASEDGGAIFNTDKLTITNTTLLNNNALYGGAIHNYYGNSSITDTILNNNSATDGGAIYNEGTGFLILTNTNINNNTAWSGGAIRNFKGKATITNSSINNNNANWFGGAIDNDNSNLTLKNTTLQNNTSMRTGGAIENNGNLTITQSNLNNNNAERDGGAIHNYRGSVTITDSTINNNYAKLAGGAIESNGNLTITQSNLKNNNAELGGGAINNEGNLTITNSTINNNTSKLAGGAIYDSSSNTLTNIISSNFTQNTANLGAAIYATGDVNLTENTFKENTATGNKETIYLSNNLNGLFEGNIYESTDINLREISLHVIDDQSIYDIFEDVVLNFTMQPEYSQYYKDFEDGINDITIYLDGVKYDTTRYENYSLSGLELGEHEVYFTSCHRTSNTISFTVRSDSEITTPQDSYEYYDGVNNKVPLLVTDISGEKGTITVSVKNESKYVELFNYHNINKEYNLSTVAIIEAVENLYTTLDSSYKINVLYTSNNKYVNPSSTEITVNITKQRNTTIAYNIINNTEGNVQINITVMDTVYQTPVTDASIKVTGDITANTTSGVLTDETLTQGDYTITVQYPETSDYKASEAIIEFNVEIDYNKKISELEDKISNLTEQLEELTKIKNTTLIINEIKDAKIYQNVTITGLLVSDDVSIGNQIITLTVNGENVDVKTVNGAFEYPTEFKTLGEETVTASYAGNDKYAPSDAESSFEVVKNDVVITVMDVEDVAYGDDVIVVASVTDGMGNALYNTNVKVSINTQTVNVKTDKNGLLTYTTKAKSIGENTVTLSYAGNAYYDTTSESTTFNVEAQDVLITIDPINDVAYGDSAVITGNVIDANGNALYNTHVKATINGKTITVKTDENGVFTLTRVQKNLGENTITVTLPGNTYFNTYTADATYNVVKQNVTVTVDEFTYNGGNFTITGKFTDANGNSMANSNVLIVLNGKTTYAKTDSEGTYTLNGTTKLKQLEFTVGYAGNTYYNTYEGTKTTMTFA